MIEEIRIIVFVRNDDVNMTEISKSYSTKKEKNAIDNAMAYLNELKKQPIKKNSGYYENSD